MFDLETKELCSGLFSDVMDRMGYRKQIITGMKRNHKRVNFIGRARTVELRAENRGMKIFAKDYHFWEPLEREKYLL